jgi:hypothetical protein
VRAKAGARNRRRPRNVVISFCLLTFAFQGQLVVTLEGGYARHLEDTVGI